MKTINPVPKKYRKGYNGCLHNPRDSRDLVLGINVFYTPDPKCPSWEEGFDNEEKYGRLKREHQGSSLSCVGQGWSKYLEMLNKIELTQKQFEETFVDLSARDIYSQIYLPDGGSYIREGAKIAVNKGNCKEVLMSSYENGNPPTEQFMRKRDANSQTEADALIYKSQELKFITLPHPLQDEDWEHIRQIVWQFGGFVSGYKRHCMYVPTFKLIDGKRSIKFINSYGEGSDRWWSEGDENPLYDITFLLDLPNPPDIINMLKIIGDLRDNKQYLVGSDKKLRWIFNETILRELADMGIINPNDVQWVNDISKYEIVKPLASIA